MTSIYSSATTIMGNPPGGMLRRHNSSAPLSTNVDKKNSNRTLRDSASKSSTSSNIVPESGMKSTVGDSSETAVDTSPLSQSDSSDNFNSETGPASRSSMQVRTSRSPTSSGSLSIASVHSSGSCDTSADVAESGSRNNLQVECNYGPKMRKSSNSIAMPRILRSLKQSFQSVMSSFNISEPSLPMGRFLVLASAIIYGTNFATVKMIDDVMPMAISASLRFGLAALVVAGAVLGNEPPQTATTSIAAKERHEALVAGAEIGLWYCVGYICQAEGLQTVEAGKSAFFNALAVVVVPLLDAAFKGKVLRGKDLASVALACFGVGLLELGPTGGVSVSAGDLLAFGQTIFFGVGYWRLEAVSHQYPAQAGRITVGQLGTVAVGSMIYALLGTGLSNLPSIEEFEQWLGDPFILGALIWTGLISTALALFLETVALQVVSASELTLLMTTTSLWGATFAWATLGEMLSATGMFGGLLILAGCVLGNLEDKKKEKVTRNNEDEFLTEMP